jgi:uncharacterized protein YhaN
MKFNSVELLSFGKLVNKKINFGENINVIFGENESGKTTIMNAIMATLYGIYPTNKEKNQKVNWYNDKLDLKANINIKNKEYEVYRSLNANVIGTMSHDEKIEKINNKNLRFINEIPKYIYKDLYYLNSKVMDNLGDNTWKKIDDKLIYSYNNSVIRNPEIVISEIESELAAIWRDNNRGNYKLKEIDQKIIDYKRKRNSLIEEYNKIKEEIKRVYYLRSQIINSEKELNQKIGNKDIINNILPVANILIEINMLKDKYYKYDIYRKVDKNILENREVLKEKRKFIVETIDKINYDIDLIKLKFERYTEKEMLIEKEENNIKTVIDKYRELVKNKEKHSESINSEKLLFNEYKKVFYEIFNKIYTNEYFKEISNIDVSELKNKMLNKKKMFLSVLLIIIGIIINYFRIKAIDIIIISSGIGLMLNVFTNRTVNLKELKIFNVNRGIILKFEKLKELEFKLLSIKKENLDRKKILENKWNDINDFFMKYKLAENLNSNIEMIIKMIIDVKEKKANDGKNKYLLNKLEEDKRSSFDKKNKVINQLDENSGYLINLSNSTVDDGINYFNENRKIESRIEILNDNLKAIKNYNVLINEFNHSKFEISMTSLNLVSKEIDNIKDLINNNKIEIIEHEKQIGEKDIYDEICEINTGIELLDIKKNNFLKEKENLIFMREIIKLSNKKFKEENQPNIIKDVNKLFNLFTGSKYDKIYIDENTKEIYIRFEEFNKEINSGFSRGTKDQFFLALRFALIKHYERDIKLPIVLDEIFSNWDDNRINNFIVSLNKIIPDRQLIILTCKKNILAVFNDIDDLNVELIKID